jgi:hypothetical protein
MQDASHIRDNSRRWKAIAGAAVVLAVLTWSARPTPGQQGGTQPQAYRAPRLEGTTHPNLNGIWQAYNTADYDLQRHDARPALAMRKGPAGPVPMPEVLALGATGGIPGSLGVVEGNDIPYQPWAAAKKKENSENWLSRDPEIKCYLPGVPRATYQPYPFQIVQGNNKIMIAYEFASAARTIHLDAVEESPADSWMGQSLGRWDGDTLVVDVTSLNDQTWFDKAGNFHSDALHVTERYTPLTPYHLMYEATIEDPKVFTRPWKIRMPLYRHMEPDFQLMEYRCVGFVEELMYGHLRKVPLSRRMTAIPYVD